MVLLDKKVDTGKETDTFFEKVAQRLVAEGTSEKDIMDAIEEAEAVGKKTRRFKIRPEDLPTIATMATGWKVDNRKR